MTKAEKAKLESLVAQRLIEALEAEHPSASMVKEAIAFLAKLQSGDIRTAAGEAEKAEEQSTGRHKPLPFPVSGQQPAATGGGSLDGLPFVDPDKPRSLPFPVDPGRSLGS